MPEQWCVCAYVRTYHLCCIWAAYVCTAMAIQNNEKEIQHSLPNASNVKNTMKIARIKPYEWHFIQLLTAKSTHLIFSRRSLSYELCVMSII